MGELGFPTRVLSPIFGGVYTYATPMLAGGTAAGQVSAKYLRHLYRVEKLGKSAKIYGVIADPVRHSISPAVHNRAFQSRRVDAVYLPFLVIAHLPARLLLTGRQTAAGRLQRDHSAQAEDHPLPGRGGSAGAPHWRSQHGVAQGRKVARHQYRCRRCHRASGTLAAPAEIVGADCGQRRRGARSGLRSVRCRRQNLAGGPQSRSRARAGQSLRGGSAACASSWDRRHFDAVVHATPLGMFPHVDECFFNGHIPADMVFDMVYNPPRRCW